MDEITQDVQNYLASASTSEFYQQEVDVLEQWEGSDNLLWRVQSKGQTAVLKLFLDAGQARGRRQHDGQERFAPLGIAPRPLWFDRYPFGLSRQVLVYEWLPGEMLNPSNASDLESLAHTVAQLHSGDPNEVRRFCPHPVNLDYFWRVLQGSFAPIKSWLDSHNGSQLALLLHALQTRGKALVESALPLWQGVSPAPVHGDLKFENYLSSFGQAVLLDWEMFGLGDPALDIASFLHIEQSTLDAALSTTWLDSYLSAFDQPGLAQRIGVYQTLLPLQSLCYLLDGIRLADSETLSDQNTIDFLKATLKPVWLQSASAFGQPLQEDLEMLLNQLEWNKQL